MKEHCSIADTQKAFQKQNEIQAHSMSFCIVLHCNVIANKLRLQKRDFESEMEEEKGR